MLWQNWLTSIGWPHWFISRSIDFATNIGSIYLISSCARRTCDEKKIGTKKKRLFLDQSKASSVCAQMTIWFSASPIRYHFSWHATKELTAWINYVQTSLIRNHLEKGEQNFDFLQINSCMQNFECMCEVRAKIHHSAVREVYKVNKVHSKCFQRFCAPLCSLKERSEAFRHRHSIHSDRMNHCCNIY